MCMDTPKEQCTIMVEYILLLESATDKYSSKLILSMGCRKESDLFGAMGL